MNAFADVIVGFGRQPAPRRTRLGNEWQAVATGPGAIWASRDGTDDRVAFTTVERPGWRTWVVGDAFAYRGSEADVVDRMADDLAVGALAADELDVHAVVVAWHEAPRLLHVITDRLGTMQAYAAGTRVGTFLPAVAEAGGDELDWVSITGFCGFGFHPADRTIHRDVRVLRPATWTTFDDRGREVSSTRYWSWSHAPEHGRSEASLLDELDAVLTRTVNRQTRGRSVVIPLSGGLDSRTLFAAATGPAATAAAVETLTYGYTERSREIAISQRVAAARGHRAEPFVVGPYVFDRLGDILDAGEAYGNLTFTRQVAIADHLPALGSRVVGGHWGDVWFDTAGAGPLAADPSTTLVDVALKKFSRPGGRWLLDNLCRHHLGGADPDAVLRSVVEAELDRLPDLGDADMQLKALKTEQWSFRWTLPSVRTYQLGVPTLLPFYGNELVDFVLRVPAAAMAGRSLQVAHLQRHHPDLAAVTWQQTGMPLRSGPIDKARMLAGRVTDKAARTLTGTEPIQRNWEVQYLHGTGPASVRAQLAHRELRALVDGDAIEALLDGFFGAPTGANGYTVDALVTLAALLADDAHRSPIAGRPR